MSFIHVKVRLNASMTQAMRFFLIEGSLEKWLGKPIKVENKLNGQYWMSLSFQDLKWESKGFILDKQFERSIKISFFESNSHQSTVEIFFMPCTSKTTYCTEIHLIHKDVKDMDFIQKFWEEKCNILRENFNGSWVIEDRDLVLSTLKGGF